MAISPRFYDNLPLHSRMVDQEAGVLEHVCDQGIQPTFDRLRQILYDQQFIYDARSPLAEGHLDWLGKFFGLQSLQGHYLGLGLGPDWEVADKRYALFAAFDYWQRKGTRSGIRKAIRIWLGWEDYRSEARLSFLSPTGGSQYTYPLWIDDVSGFEYRELLQDFYQAQRLGSGDILPGNFSSAQRRVDGSKAQERFFLSRLTEKNTWLHYEFSEDQLDEWNQLFPRHFPLNTEIFPATTTPVVTAWINIQSLYPLSEDPNYDPFFYETEFLYPLPMLEYDRGLGEIPFDGVQAAATPTRRGRLVDIPSLWGKNLVGDGRSAPILGLKWSDGFHVEAKTIASPKYPIATDIYPILRYMLDSANWELIITTDQRQYYGHLFTAFWINPLTRNRSLVFQDTKVLSTEMIAALLEFTFIPETDDTRIEALQLRLKGSDIPLLLERELSLEVHPNLTVGFRIQLNPVVRRNKPVVLRWITGEGQFPLIPDPDYDPYVYEKELIYPLPMLNYALPELDEFQGVQAAIPDGRGLLDKIPSLWGQSEILRPEDESTGDRLHLKWSDGFHVEEYTSKKKRPLVYVEKYPILLAMLSGENWRLTLTTEGGVRTPVFESVFWVNQLTGENSLIFAENLDDDIQGMELYLEFKYLPTSLDVSATRINLDFMSPEINDIVVKDVVGFPLVEDELVGIRLILSYPIGSPELMEEDPFATIRAMILGYCDHVTPPVKGRRRQQSIAHGIVLGDNPTY